MTKFAVLALLCLAVAASAVPIAGAATPIVPSQAQAIHDVKVELLDHYVALMDTTRPRGSELMPMAQVGCDPLSDSLYRCTFIGKSPLFYDVTGRAKVRFYKYASDVSLYNVKCYNTTRIDSCAMAG